MVRMDVNNFGPGDLYLRLLFENLAGPGPPIDLALSADAVFVPASSGWMNIKFPISPKNLVVDSFGTVSGALSNTDTLRLFHNPAPTFPGPGAGIPLVSVTLGVDNIIATVPEPATLMTLLTGMLAMFARRLARFL